MAQKYVVVERKNPLKPQEAAKFYAMARSNRRVDTDEVISRVSETVAVETRTTAIMEKLRIRQNKI